MSTELEVWLVADVDGNYEVGTDRENAIERFDDNIGGGGSRRVVSIRVQMDLPEEPEVEVDVPETAGETIVTVEDNEDEEVAA